MPPPPLTHHEILEWVAPFSRRGCRVDLAATDRMARRVEFQPVERPGTPAHVERLQLDEPRTGWFRLTCLRAMPGAVEARLRAEGPDRAQLLADVEAIDPALQWNAGAGYAVAYSHEVEPGRSLRLVAAEARLARAPGVVLAMKAPSVSGYPAELDLAADGMRPPDDLFAVLGWRWSLLRNAGNGWAATFEVDRREPRRSRGAEAKFVRAAAHLASTLAQPPARFHEQHVGARWLVVLRRSLPLVAVAALMLAAAAVPKFGIRDDSVMRMLVLNAPPLLLMLVFCMREMPRIEIPPIPRRPGPTAWTVCADPAPMTAGPASPAN